MLKLSFSSQKNVWLELLKNAISERLKNNKTIVSKYCALILNTDGWICFNIADEFTLKSLKNFMQNFTYFRKKLQNCLDSIAVLAIHYNSSIYLLNMFQLTFHQISIHIISYGIESLSQVSKKSGIQLCVAELLFALPEKKH